MNINDFDFSYPKELIALEPAPVSRVAWFQGTDAPREKTLDQLILEFQPGDVLVVNDSKVVPARVFSQDEVEVLFLRAVGTLTWEVLFPARDFAPGDVLSLPGGIELKLNKKGLPQVVEVSRPLTSEYFLTHGEVALPPYIQEARGERHNRPEDRSWYQTAWAATLGSVAAPTASLHFKQTHLATLNARGVEVLKLTLHVGAGTFLPVRTQELKEHQMHSEVVEIPDATLKATAAARVRGGRVWALGTTVARSLEAHALGRLNIQDDGRATGATNLFIYPPYQFRAVDVLLTNFHQPKSTLFALVAAFAGLERARAAYTWAIENHFRLFSYGDLSVWTKP